MARFHSEPRITMTCFAPARAVTLTQSSGLCHCTNTPDVDELANLRVLLIHSLGGDAPDQTTSTRHCATRITGPRWNIKH